MSELLNKKGIFEMLALVKSGRISIVRDEYGNIRSINCNRPGLEVSDVKYTKMLNNGCAVGATLEELQEDEKAMRKFAEEWAHTDVLHLAVVAERLAKPELTDDDIAYLKRELELYVECHKEIKRVEVPVRSETPRTGNGKYPALYENLYVLDVETLKEMKRVATRMGANDLKNACRTILRHKGINC